MKIYKLIDLLRAHDPEGDVQGVEGLSISSPLIPSEESPKATLRSYVKGTKRLAVADAHGTPESIAAEFNIPVAKVIQIKALRKQGKL
jgi:hypothetical protein